MGCRSRGLLALGRHLTLLNYVRFVLYLASFIVYLTSLFIVILWTAWLRNLGEAGPSLIALLHMFGVPDWMGCRQLHIDKKKYTLIKKYK